MENKAVFFICTFCSSQIPAIFNLDQSLVCRCCGEIEKRLKPKSAELTLAYSLTALILYVPANIYPFMTIELYGNRQSSTIWSGVISLLDSGSWAIGIVVFLASMIIPCLKLVALFYLALFAKNPIHPRLMTRLYHAIEAIGRWSMLDIFLLAVLVAIMKLGPWTSVKPELGSFLFVLVVIFTMLASSSFDPRLLWEVKNAQSE